MGYLLIAHLHLSSGPRGGGRVTENRAWCHGIKEGDGGDAAVVAAAADKSLRGDCVSEAAEPRRLLPGVAGTGSLEGLSTEHGRRRLELVSKLWLRREG